MTRPARSALLLQGGGALGAFEFGAVQALCEKNLGPDVIAGVSIGAITAVLLARPASGMTPLQALAAFWKKVTVQGNLFLPALRPYASFFGNPHFFTLRPDFVTWPFAWWSWTHFYETQPLRDTLNELVNLNALKDPNADPLLLVSATNVKTGQIEYFDSRQGGLTLDHIIASGSLPPAFPMTEISAQSHYWDGGLFDNTPLGAVLDTLDTSPDTDRVVYVVNLFPSEGPIPNSMLGVAERMKNIQFSSKTQGDIKLLCRFNEVARLMQVLDTFPADHPVKQDNAYSVVKKRGYVQVPRIVSITLPEPAGEFSDADFSPEAIEERRKQGYTQTLQALKAAPQDPCSILDNPKRS